MALKILALSDKISKEHHAATKQCGRICLESTKGLQKEYNWTALTVSIPSRQGYRPFKPTSPQKKISTLEATPHNRPLVAGSKLKF